MSRWRWDLQREHLLFAAVPLLVGLIAMLLVISASDTAPDGSNARVAGLFILAPTTSPAPATSTSTPSRSSTTTSTTTTSSPPVIAPPQTAPPETAPPPDLPPASAPPATRPPVTTAPAPPPAVTVNLRYSEPACGQAATSATGCARGAGRVEVIDSSGAAAVTGAVRTIGPAVRQLTSVLDVRAVTTTWNVLVTLDYVGPCGLAPVIGVIRYQLAVSPGGSVLLSGVNGSSGSLRRPQPSDPTWLASIEPYRFASPEPGCTR